MSFRKKFVQFAPIATLASIAQQVAVLFGAIAISVILQGLWMKPSQSEVGLAEGQLKGLAQEIEVCGRDANAFVRQMKLHAADSKKFYIDALRNLTPKFRAEMNQTCQSPAGGDLISRSRCYKLAMQNHKTVQLHQAAGAMSASIDRFIRWGALAAACDQRAGQGICRKLRSWKAEDFVLASEAEAVSSSLDSS